MTEATRIVARRDSATTILRKIGVKVRDYDLFITKQTDGQFAVNVKLATKHVQDVAAQTGADTPPWEGGAGPVKGTKKVTRPAKPTKKGAVSAPRAANGGGTVSDEIRRLIKAGRTNAEIWAEVQPRFGLADNKRHYPAWYRSELRRRGEL